MRTTLKKGEKIIGEWKDGSAWLTRKMKLCSPSAGVTKFIKGTGSIHGTIFMTNIRIIFESLDGNTTESTEYKEIETIIGTDGGGDSSDGVNIYKKNGAYIEYLLFCGIRFANTINSKFFGPEAIRSRNIELAQEREKHLDYDRAIQIYEENNMPEEAGRIRKLILEVKAKIANEYERLLDYNKAIEAYKDAELPDEVIRVTKLIGDDKVKHLDYDKAIEIYESIGDKEAAKNARKLKSEEGAVKVTQKVVHGDEVTKTEIKDSVLNRSNVGSGGKSKAEEIKEIKELLDSGAIDDDEFKQMKKEILGK